jgi:hypothetical protein
MIEALESAVDSLGANLVFGFIVLAFVGALMLMLLFAGLAVRGAWRWLKRHSWRDAVTTAERKALRSR